MFILFLCSFLSYSLIESSDEKRLSKGIVTAVHYFIKWDKIKWDKINKWTFSSLEIMALVQNPMKKA